MDKLEQYRQILQKIIEKHSAYKPTYGKIETIQICDLVHDNYLLMNVGWDQTGRVHAVDLHLRIKENKIWIEWDGTENGVSEELLEAEVLPEDIVLGFCLAIITMQDELSKMINRQVDLRTPEDLSRYFRGQVLAEAMVIKVAKRN